MTSTVDGVILGGAAGFVVGGISSITSTKLNQGVLTDEIVGSSPSKALTSCAMGNVNVEAASPCNPLLNRWDGIDLNKSQLKLVNGKPFQPGSVSQTPVFKDNLANLKKFWVDC